MARLADFEGRWRVARQIDDRALGRTGRFEGVVTFAPTEAGLTYLEVGELTFAGAKPMAARRRYLWQVGQEGRDGIDVYFDDGRFFHHIAPGPEPEASHWCDPDRYEVAYGFQGWPDWRARWTVLGPNKDYTMDSLHIRIAP